MRAHALILLAGLHAGAAAIAAEPRARIILQHSPLAGLRYHDAAAVWEDMRAGDVLALVREPANPHDANAIRIEWRGRTIGYVPRMENGNLARQLDHGAAASARIVELKRHRNGQRRLTYEIFVPLEVVKP